MARIRVSVDIDADVATVWSDVERLDTHSEWMADAESIDFVDDQRRGVGVVMRVLTRIGPLRTTDIIRVTSGQPRPAIGVHHDGLVEGTGEFRLEPLGDSCRFVWEERLSFPWYFGGSIGGLAAVPVLKIVWRGNLRRLARRLGSP